MSDLSGGSAGTGTLTVCGAVRVLVDPGRRRQRER